MLAARLGKRYRENGVPAEMSSLHVAR